ncbi:unnamed protein product [Acanthosepion pharaonis]|uniref:Uncharacterized protein n=1 Tax=Acanthosepion pharaonis TaxID=158019 RepID=A0A812D0L6_ACAPH|nr:unnamed protein product [Sepia pharaonis]
MHKKEKKELRPPAVSMGKSHSSTVHFQSFQGPKVFIFSLLCRESSLYGDQTLFFLHLFSSRPPGYYAFLLRLLECGNLLKHVVKYFLKTHVFAPSSSSQTALAPNSTYGLLFKLSFLRLLREDFSKNFSEGKNCPQQFLTHASFTYGQTLPAFSAGRERKTPVSQRSRFQLLLRSSPSSPFPFKGGGAVHLLPANQSIKKKYQQVLRASNTMSVFCSPFTVKIFKKFIMIINIIF